MDTTNKPIASIGVRVAVATISLLGSIFFAIGVAFPGSTFEIFGPLFAVDKISITTSTASTILVIGRLLYLCLLPVFGFLGDKLGRLKLIIIGLILVGLSVAFISFVSTSILFGLAVFCLNIGTAMTIACLLSFILEAVTSRWFLSLAAVIYLSAIYVANMLSPILGGQLSSQSNITKLFMIAGAITAGCLLFGGVLAFIANNIKNRFQWVDDWLNHSRNQHQRVTLSLLLIIVFLIFMSNSLLTNSFPYLNRLNLISTNDWAILMTYSSISFLIGFSSIGVLSDLLNWLSVKFIKKNIGRISLLVLGLLIIFIGYFVTALSKVQPSTALPSLIIPTFLSGLGFGVSLPPIIALIVEQVPRYRWGLTISVYFAVCAMGILAVPFITSYLLESSGYSPQLSTQPTSVTVAITSTIPWLLLISISIALIIGMIALVINLKPLQDISALEAQ